MQTKQIEFHHTEHGNKQGTACHNTGCRIDAVGNNKDNGTDNLQRRIFGPETVYQKLWNGNGVVCLNGIPAKPRRHKGPRTNGTD